MKKLLIIIPVYNEEKILESAVYKIKNFFDKKFSRDINNISYKIAIAGRSSTDKTNEIAQMLEKKYNNVIYSKVDHPDKCRRIHKISMNSDYNFYAFIDCDLPITMEEFYTIICEVIHNGADMSLASRYVNGAVQKRQFRRVFVSKTYNLLISLLLPTIKTHDAMCGIKAWNRKVTTTIFPKATHTNYFFDTEILYYCFENDYKVTEIPVFYKETRTDSKVNILSDSLSLGISLIKFFIYKSILRK